MRHPAPAAARLQRHLNLPVCGERGVDGAVALATTASEPWVDALSDDEDARLMSGPLHAVGGCVCLTTAPGLDHLRSPEAAWTMPGLWDWLLEQRRGAPSQPEAAPTGPAP